MIFARCLHVLIYIYFRFSVFPLFRFSDILAFVFLACNCVLNNTVNHNSSVCNVTSGRCSCKTYVGGQQCERCDDNYYNTSHGCRGREYFVTSLLPVTETKSDTIDICQKERKKGREGESRPRKMI